MVAGPGNAKRRRVMPVMISSAEAHGTAASQQVKSEQVPDDASCKKLEDKSKLETALNDIFKPTTEDASNGKEGQKKLEILEKLCQEFKFDASVMDTLVALKEDPASRGTFANIVEKQLEEKPPSSTLKVPKVVQHLSLSDDYVALTTGPELHILHLKSEKDVQRSYHLENLPVLLKCIPQGRVILLLQNGSLLVWDVSKDVCLLQTSLRHICSHGDVRSLGLHSKTGEPIVGVKDGNHYLFSKTANAWICLKALEARQVDSASLDPASGRLDESSYVKALEFAKCADMESDLFSAACFSSAEFQLRLESLVRHYAMYDVERLRRLCTDLLGRSADVSFAKGPLACTLAGLDLCGRKLVSDVVLPVLGGSPACQQLWSDLSKTITGDVSSSNSKLPPIF